MARDSALWPTMTCSGMLGGMRHVDEWLFKAMDFR